MTERKEQAIALRKNLSEVSNLVADLEIQNEHDLKEAANIGKAIKAYQKSVSEFWGPLVENAHSTWKSLTAKRNEFLNPAKDLEASVKKKIAEFDRKMRLQAEEERRKALEQETKAAEARRLADLAELEESGLVDEAASLAEQPLDVAPIQKIEAPKAEGVHTRENWTAEVIDFQKLIEFCAENPRWNYLLAPKGPELNKLAKAQKKAFDIPGVEAKCELTTVIR